MKLVAITPPLREGQRVRCHICGTWTKQALADLDGEPFVAFVCIGTCAPRPEDCQGCGQPTNDAEGGLCAACSAQ